MCLTRCSFILDLLWTVPLYDNKVVGGDPLLYRLLDLRMPSTFAYMQWNLGILGGGPPHVLLWMEFGNLKRENSDWM